MSVYKHLDYRLVIMETVETRKKLPGKFTLRQLAEASGLQASFLTNVLKGRFDFNADQIYAVAVELGYSPDERDYLLLLLEYQRSVHKPRREDLKRRIEHIRKENQKSEKHLAQKVIEPSSGEQARFYLDPFAQIILVYLNVAPYNRQPERLGTVLGLSQSHLGEVLEVLVRLGYVKRESGVYKVLERHMHLPLRNALSQPSLALMRMKCIDQLQRLSADQTYSHSVTLSGTDETKTLLSDAYISFLKKAEAIVKPARAEKVFQMSFDLFPWDL